MIRPVLASFAGAFLLSACNTVGEPMGGPYEQPGRCTAGVVEVGPGTYSHDVLSGNVITTIERNTAETIHEPCP